MRENLPLRPGPFEAAEVVLPCDDLHETIAAFTDLLGFRVDAIFPADAPSTAVVSGHGLRVRLDTKASGDPGFLRLVCRDRAERGPELVLPNGTRVQFVATTASPVIPPLRSSFVHQRGGEGEWGVGRAGMRYRDLIPDRQGGRFIASHIHVPDGGPVPDYPHYHVVRFQMIYCYRGWVRVVYEDQGGSFVLAPGDCVLQPPQIRHRVLESSRDLRVIEVSCPAEHETRVDHQITLPTDTLRPERNFDGQRFVHHVAAQAAWRPWKAGFLVRDTGISSATDGLAGVVVIRRDKDTLHARGAGESGDELFFLFVLLGRAEVSVGEAVKLVREGDAVVVPVGSAYELIAPSADFEALLVLLPG